jgi:hypothetical protein
MQTARRAVEQRDPELALERGQRPHYRRQRRIERIRGGRQTAGVHDPHEGLHRQEFVHGDDYYFIK